MEKCKYYTEKFTKQRYILGKEFLECNYEKCPYNNQTKIQIKSDWSEIKICETKGLVKKI